MKTRRMLFRTFATAALLTIGSGHVSADSCTPSSYAYCAGKREACLLDGNEEEVCEQLYIACLAQRGCD